MTQTPPGFAGRHSANTPAPQVTSWKCPACSADQVGIFGTACTKCGSGGGAKHVGIDPVARPDLARQLPSDPRESPALLRSRPSADLESAWIAWIRPFRGKWDSAQEEIAYLAFQAGYLYASGQVVAQTVNPPLSGTAESRTLIAALRLYVENLAPISTEEIKSGELLSIAETEALIAKLEGVS